MISSVSNREIVSATKLNQKKYRDLEDKFLIEGIKLFKEARKNKIAVEKVFILPELKEKIDLTNTATQEVSPKVLAKLSTQKSPEGLVAIISKDKLLPVNTPEKIILLDNIRDPGNLGTIIRTADAAGLDAVFCSKNCADLYNSKTIRSTMGSVFHIPIVTNANLVTVIDKLKSRDVKVIGTALDGDLLYLNRVPALSSFALLLGNESHGLSGELYRKCDSVYRLPIFGQAESLNVSIAAGIFMYALTDQYCETQ